MQNTAVDQTYSYILLPELTVRGFVLLPRPLVENTSTRHKVLKTLRSRISLPIHASNCWAKPLLALCAPGWVVLPWSMLGREETGPVTATDQLSRATVLLRLLWDDLGLREIASR